MSQQPKIHPYAIESHHKNMAWNDYVIAYFGLTLIKIVKDDYKALILTQGKAKLFDLYDFQLRRMSSVDMHRRLRIYLEGYIENFGKYHKMEVELDFKPPERNKL